jgi:hypothetical protein
MKRAVRNPRALRHKLVDQGFTHHKAEEIVENIAQSAKRHLSAEDRAPLLKRAKTKLAVCELEVTKAAMRNARLKTQLKQCQSKPKKEPVHSAATTIRAAQAAAVVSAAAVVQAVDDGMVSKKNAAALAMRTTMSVMKDADVLHASSNAATKRRITPVTLDVATPAAAAASEAVIAGGKKQGSKAQEIFARHVDQTVQHLVKAHGLEMPKSTGEAALGEVEKQLRGGHAFGPRFGKTVSGLSRAVTGDQPATEEDIYETRLEGDCRGKLLFVHKDKTPVEAEQQTIDTLNCKHVSLDALMRDPTKMKGTCLIWGKIELPQDDDLEKMVNKMQKSMKKVERVLIVHPTDANDIAALVFEPIYARDVFEGYKSFTALKTRFK